MKWNKLYWLKVRVQQIEDEIKELTVLSAVSISGMPSSNSVSSPVELYYNRLAKLEAKKAKAQQKVDEEEKRLESMIESIEDAEVQAIAWDRLYYCKDWETIGRERNMDRTTASKRLRKYLGKDDVQ